MPEDMTKRLSVTFCAGLPLGRHARFKHENEHWIALPAAKYRDIRAVTDRLIGSLHSIREQLIRWLASNPNDAQRVRMLLDTIARADSVATTAAADKGKAQTA